MVEEYIPFKVIVNCPFREIAPNLELNTIDKKYSVCMVNGFEDGKWMLETFLEYIWDNIAETALSAEERIALGKRPSTLLKRSAKNLRITDKDTSGGEIAEILLYSIMRNFYGALPVVPKIFYKQNANDFAKGADSVHVVLEPDGSFSLWLGEAKFYSSLENSRLDKVVSSVLETLSTEKIKKENSIIIGLKDLDNLGLEEDMVTEIKNLLGCDKSIDLLKPNLHIPILLLHECNVTAKSTSLSDEYVEAIKVQYADRATAYFSKQIEMCKEVYLYSEITFHLILIPVPDKEVVVKEFVKRAKIYR